MNQKNIFLADFVYILPNGGFLAGKVLEGEIKIGMQAEIGGKILEITNLQVGEEIKERVIKDQQCAFMFVCKEITEGEIKKGEQIEFFEPKA